MHAGFQMRAAAAAYGLTRQAVTQAAQRMGVAKRSRAKLPSLEMLEALAYQAEMVAGRQPPLSARAILSKFGIEHTQANDRLFRKHALKPPRDMVRHIHRESAHENPKIPAVLEVIKNNPGLPLSQICRDHKISLSTVSKHIERLRKNDLEINKERFLNQYKETKTPYWWYKLARECDISQKQALLAIKHDGLPDPKTATELRNRAILKYMSENIDEFRNLTSTNGDVL